MESILIKELFSVNDKLNFYKDEVPQYQRLVEFLNFRKDDIAIATNTPKNRVRYDKRIPRELGKQLQEWAIAINLVANHFNDIDKTKLWFQTPNPLLGHIAPRDMIRLGRFKKLYEFIIASIDENKKGRS